MTSKTNRFQALLPALAIFFAVFFSVHSATAADKYSIKRLDPLLGSNAAAYSINAGGQVAGGSGEAHAPSAIAVLWSANGATRIRSSDRSDFAAAYGVNMAQQVVGSTNTETALRAFSWTEQDGMSLLPVLTGDTSSEALAVNDKGMIAGFSGGSSGLRAVLWMGGQVRALDGLTGSDHSEAVALNSAGDAVGFSDAAGHRRAVLWAGSAHVRDLGLLAGDASSSAAAINDSRQVAGTSDGENGSRAFLWSESEGLQDLGTLPGGIHSRAAALDNHGAVVGTSDSTLGQRAFLWTREDGMVDLNTLIPSDSNVILRSAVAINDAGQIVALGGVGHDLAHDRPADFDDEAHGGITFVFVLTPRR